MHFAMTTDYLADIGNPEPALAAIAHAGFHYLHWCHEWNTDHLYTPAELRLLESALRRLNLQIHDLHASHGRQHPWDSPHEPTRHAGVQLVQNRLHMAARFHCPVIILHPADLSAPDAPQRFASLRRSLTDLLPDLHRLNVRIALENMATLDTFDQLEKLLAEFPPDVLGLCYDSGHGALAGNGLDRLEPLATRLLALHLHDNDAHSDLHQPLFMGRVDWPRLAHIIRQAPPRPALSIEVVQKNSHISDESEFLQHTLHAAQKFGALLDGPAPSPPRA